MPDLLAWLDLEMTGLDPARHAIVEIASLVTDADLTVVAEGPDLVVHQPDHVLAGMDTIVRDMHTRSGLLADVRGSTVGLAAAEGATLDFLVEHLPAAGVAPLCGNSIHVDRRFLFLHMPRLDAYLHYRCIDVSTVKELARRWYPAAYDAAPRKAGAHRALADIHESVAELRHYRGAVFRDVAPRS